MKLQIPILGVIVVVLAGVVGCAQYRIVADERNPSEGELSESVCGWSCDLEGGRKVRRVSQEHSEKKNLGWRALDWIRGKSGFRRLIANEDYEHATVKLFRSLGYLPDNMLNDVVVLNDVIQNGDIAIVKRT